jgi:hypothetical protein
MKNLSLFISQKIITKQAASGAVVGNKSTQAISAIATAGIGFCNDTFIIQYFTRI